MDNELNNTRAEAEKIIEVTPNSFKGYTIEEIRYQRALVALQKEFAKSKITNQVNKVKNRKFFGTDAGASKLAKASGVAGKLLSGLSYLDYAMLGLSVFKTGRKIFSFFRGRR